MKRVSSVVFKGSDKKKKPAGSRFLICFLFLRNSRNGAGTCAGEARNANVLIALGLSIFIE
jgi:hypothetical protein